MAFADMIKCTNWSIDTSANSESYGHSDSDGAQTSQKGNKSWTMTIGAILTGYGPLQYSGSGAVNVNNTTGFAVGKRMNIKAYENGSLFHQGAITVAGFTVSGDLQSGRMSVEYEGTGSGALTMLTPSAGTAIMSSQDGDIEWEAA